MDIQFDRYSLILNGRREFIRSGAIHYFRLPHPDLWWDRLQKLKMGGYNTIDVYFNWDFHSPAPGQYDFSGERDIKRLLDMIESLGLYFIGRPGPYINAETTRGGLPGWLLTEPDVIPRNRVDGAYQYSPRYMTFVREWFNHILPFLKNRDNMLMIQVENEYSTLDMEPDYMEELTRIIRSHGITVPTMHNDFYAAGLYADVVDLYAIDNYSVTLFDLNWRTFPDLFSVMDHLEQGIRPEFCENRPLMVAELQAGWFAGWKGVPYDTIHKSLGREHIGLITRSFLGQGGTVFNHYKAVGGTNWNHIGATDAYTSYDFSAPISESGLPTERFYEAKHINLLLKHFDLTQTERATPEDIGLSHNASFYVLRQDLNQPGAYWLFTRNLTGEPLTLELPGGTVIETSPYQAQIIPYNLQLQNGWLLEALNVEPLAQTEKCLILPGNKSVSATFSIPADPSATQSVSQTQWMALGNNRYQARLTTPLKPTEVASMQVGDYTIHFLGDTLADRLWSLDNGEFVIGPDMVISERTMVLWKDHPCYRIDTSGTCTPFVLSPEKPPHLPSLDSWALKPGGLPLWDQIDYKPIGPKGADMDNNGFHEGAVWYRYEFSGKAETLSIHAQHLWTIYLNGHCLIHSHTFHVYPEKGSPDDAVSIQLPQDLLKTDGSNVLTVFVESLGHHKGFYDDAQEPRGVISLKLDEREIHMDGHIREAVLSNGEDNNDILQDKTVSPIVYATTPFELALPQKEASPIGLLIDIDIERVNITLNGILLGKYWRSCKNQTVFYLPEGILNPNGLNHLELTLINFFPHITVETPFPKRYGEIRLVSYPELFKLSRNMVDINPD